VVGKKREEKREKKKREEKRGEEGRIKLCSDEWSMFILYTYIM
jgi:hypothetical protein